MQNPDKPTITLQAVATVHHDVPDDEVSSRRRDIIAEVRVLPRFADGLLGIEAYSHLIILFWMHGAAAGTEPLQLHPRGNPALPLTGVFASRGRSHPNPVGLAVVDLVERRGNSLLVRRLDAWSGTPVIDIKPYDYYDSYDQVRLPAWLQARQG